MRARLALDGFSCLNPVRRRWVDDPSLLAPLEVGSYLDGFVFPGYGLWWFFCGGTGSWLLALWVALGSRDGVSPLRECARVEGAGSWILAPLLLARLTMRMRNT